MPKKIVYTPLLIVFILKAIVISAALYAVLFYNISFQKKIQHSADELSANDTSYHYLQSVKSSINNQKTSDAILQFNTWKQYIETTKKIKLNQNGINAISNNLQQIAANNNTPDNAAIQRINESIDSLQNKISAAVKESNNTNNTEIASLQESTKNIQRNGTILSILILMLIITMSYFIFKLISYHKSLIKATDANKKFIENKATFLNNVAHEIRTPLAGMIGLINQVKNNNHAEPAGSEIFKSITASATHLQYVINDMLDLSKTSAGKLTIANRPFNIIEIIDEVITPLEHLLSGKNIQLSLHTSDTLPHHLMGDSFRIKQVLYNLISNAIKFTEKGEIKISVTNIIGHNSGSYVQVKISDTGIGIPVDKRKIIFEPYEQILEPYTTHNFSGTGLGLNIAKEIANLQGGDLKLSEETINGSEFIYTFPLIKNENVEAGKSSSYNNTIQNTIVLLVEDDLLNRTIAENILKKSNINYLSASTGNEALGFLKNEKIDIVITDLNLPDINGWEIAKTVKEKSLKQHKKITTVLFTADNAYDYTDKFEEYGIDGFITKPFTQKELEELLLRHSKM